MTAGLGEELGPTRPSGHTPRGCGRRRKDFKGFIQNKQTNKTWCVHEWRGEGLQHLLGATKRAFSAIFFRPTGSFKLKYFEIQIIARDSHSNRLTSEGTEYNLSVY